MTNLSSTSFRIEKEKLEKLDAIASTMKRSRNWVLNEAMNNFIEYNEYFTQKVNDGLEQANNKEFASQEDVKAVFSKYGV